MRKIKAALIGAGNRGFIYADYALTYKTEVQFVAVAEPQEHLIFEPYNKAGWIFSYTAVVCHQNIF